MPGIEREQLEGLRRDLAQARAEYDKRVAEIKAIEETHAAEYALVAQSKNLRDAIDRTLRQALCDFYYLTEDKRPCESLSIKEVKNVVYDADRVLDWALERLIQSVLGMQAMGRTPIEMVDALRNGALCLTLDTAALKKGAELGMFGDKAPFKVELVAQANISTDLSKYIE